MKRLPKYTPAEVRNDPYGFTYKEMSEVIGENEAKALYEPVGGIKYGIRWVMLQIGSCCNNHLIINAI